MKKTSVEDNQADLEIIPSRFIPEAVPVYMRRGSFLATEDPRDYKALVEGLAEEMKPRTVLEFLAVKQIADAAWEQQRLQRIKDEHLKASGATSARKLINELEHGYDRWSLSLDDFHRQNKIGDLHEAWLAGEAGAMKTVKGLLERAKVTEVAFLGRGLADNLQFYAKVDEMIRSRSGLQRAAIRDVERMQEKSKASLEPAPIVSSAEDEAFPSTKTVAGTTKRVARRPTPELQGG